MSGVKIIIVSVLIIISVNLLFYGIVRRRIADAKRRADIPDDQ